jgi:hypothetical protein
MKRRFACLACALLLAGCAGQPARELTVVRGPVGDQARSVTFRGVPLASGQIVLSEQGSAMSLFYALGLRDFLPFSHAGVLLIEDGAPFVYDAAGQLAFNPFGPPTDAIHGGIRRRALAEIIDGQGVVAIYEPPPGAHPGKMVTFAWKSVLAGHDFDPYFDDRENARLYCTEFVALAVRQAGGEPPAPVPMRRNASMAIALGWLGVSAPNILAAGSYAAPERHVATFSSRWTAAEIGAHFAFKREMHRRFGPDQKLGALYRWNGWEVDYRPDVEAFRARLMAHALERKDSTTPDGIAQADMDTLAVRLAADFFEADAPRFAVRATVEPVPR